MSNIADKMPENGKPATGEHPCLLSRRDFLLTSGAATATFTVMVTLNPGAAHAEQVPAAVAIYPRKLVGKLSEHEVDEPLDFNYPDEELYSESLVIKLSRLQLIADFFQFPF